MKFEKNNYPDYITFLDEKGNIVSWYVRILDKSSFVTFETEGGNNISIPIHRVIKIKQKGVMSNG